MMSRALNARVAKNEEEIQRLTVTGLESQKINAEIFQQNNKLRSNYEALWKKRMKSFAQEAE